MLFYKYFKLLLCAGVVFVFFGCSSGKNSLSVDAPSKSDEFVVVMAEGTADITPAGIAEATDRAYLDAQRKAIETALGKIYSAKTVVDAGRFIEQTIMAKVEGYIKKWEKLAGPEVQDFPGISDKIVWVKINAQVGKDKLKEDTFALEEIQKKLGRPDIAVAIGNSQASQVLGSKLKEKKFTVKVLDNVSGDIRESAQENGVDILIKGDVSASKAGSIMKGVDMKSYQSEVVLKAINVSDGEELSQAAGHGAYPHINDASGKAGAVQKAAASAADILIEKLLNAWEDVLNNGSNLYLKVKGLSLNDESDFKMVLERYLRGLKEVHSKGLKDGIFTYKLNYLGDAKQLAKELGSLNSKFILNISGYRTNIVEAEIK